MTKQKIILTRGLPASGKSTWAKEQVAKSNGKAKRINKDLLRDMIDAGIWSSTNEQQILDIRDLLIEYFLTNDTETIIIDDTNFEHKHFERVKLIGENTKCKSLDVEYKDFLSVPLDECIHRDSLRAKPVGEKIIKSMHQRYILPALQDETPINKKGNTIIVDIDGTLAHRYNRNWFEYDKVDQDHLDVVVYGIVEAFAKKGYNILIVSGRESTEICKQKTLAWLDKHKVPYCGLMLRKENDYRRDSIVKKEIYETLIKDRFDVEFVLDDRTQVVNMWREIGLKCLQVASGNF
jgi:predicted kinase